MTLHITVVSNSYVLQVSDRLVSSSIGLKPFDAYANKNVIYFARDAQVVIAYTGLAYLNGRPTDQWIVERLLGRDFDESHMTSDGRIASRLSTGPVRPWFDIGMASQALRRELVRAVQRLPVSERLHFPRIVMAGWQAGKRLWRPLLHVIADEGAGALYSGYEWAPRHGWLEGMFCLNLTHRNPYLNRLGATLIEELRQGPMADDADRVMGQTLRTAAHHSLGIGKDYLSVLLPQPNQQRIRIRFDPFTDETFTIPGGFSSYFGPVGYSPWIVAPQQYIPPQVMVGISSIGGMFQGFVLEFEAPPGNPEFGRYMAMTSQSRLSWPPRRQTSAITSPNWVPQSTGSHLADPAVYRMDDSTEAKS